MDRIHISKKELLELKDSNINLKIKDINAPFDHGPITLKVKVLNNNILKNFEFGIDFWLE